MAITDNEIQERYLRRAISDMHQLIDEVQGCSLCSSDGLMPIIGSGHPQADIFLLKYAATDEEIAEGVAFYGATGSAMLSSIRRLGIDPLNVYGTLCVKCPVEPKNAHSSCLQRVATEIEIVQPKLIVAMGDDVTRVLSTLDLQLKRLIDPGSSAIQQYTPEIQVLVTPTIESALQNDDAKRSFWNAFRQLESWQNARLSGCLPVLHWH